MAKIDDELKALERKIARKLSRIKSKGINAGAIDPRSNASGFTREQKQSYANRLKGFIDNPGYSRGEDGTPISNALIQQIRYTERAVNRQRAERYGYNTPQQRASKSLMGDMSVEQFQLMGTRYNPKTGRYEYDSRAQHAGSLPLPSHAVDTFHSAKAARQYLERLHKIQTPEYQNQKMKTLIDNIAKRANDMNSDALKKELREMTPAQLDELYSKSDFLAVMFIDSPPRKGNQYMGETIEQNIIMEDQESYLLELLARLKKL
jgi:vacuolar-type H+-ATPase subunit F/Vma7